MKKTIALSLLLGSCLPKSSFENNGFEEVEVTPEVITDPAQLRRAEMLRDRFNVRCANVVEPIGNVMSLGNHNSWVFEVDYQDQEAALECLYGAALSVNTMGYTCIVDTPQVKNDNFDALVICVLPKC